MKRTLAAVLFLTAWSAGAAQEHGPPAQPAAHGAPAGAEAKVDIITPHITDGYHIEIPYFKPPFYKELCLGRHIGEHGCGPLWDPIHIGAFEVNLSPTKHVVMLLLAATIVTILLITAARSHVRQTRTLGRPKGFAAAIESVVLYIRNEVILPNVGHHGERYVPFLLTVFFFILTMNLLGLVPYGATATGNIAVTATLAIVTFVVTEVSGMIALGRHYFSTIFYWNKELALPMRLVMFLILSPVELIGKFTKPIALAIRLFANMTAGHIVVLAFIGMIFTFKGLASGAPFLMAVAIMLLELFVALLQAFIFTMLSSVFIGQIREAHH
ncbi:MAG TPA: F0F1 ATP synthase subunit A [Gemmatimonadaceae bacterium]|nr:F0F1 ATP synthase subunit A [Gemmatimonadaceae bacterium]